MLTLYAENPHIVMALVFDYFRIRQWQKSQLRRVSVVSNFDNSAMITWILRHGNATFSLRQARQPATSQKTHRWKPWASQIVSPSWWKDSARWYWPGVGDVMKIAFRVNPPCLIWERTFRVNPFNQRYFSGFWQYWTFLRTSDWSHTQNAASGGKRLAQIT